MILKLFKAVWFLSLMGFMAIFMYIYASLPERVFFLEDGDSLSLSRDIVFYLSLGIVALINVLVFVISKLDSKRNEAFCAWFFGQVIVVNFFFCTVLGYFNVLNSGEKFDLERLGVVIYGSILLIVIWALSWPIYLVTRKFVGKEVIGVD